MEKIGEITPKLDEFIKATRVGRCGATGCEYNNYDAGSFDCNLKSTTIGKGGACEYFNNKNKK